MGKDAVRGVSFCSGNMGGWEGGFVFVGVVALVGDVCVFFSFFSGQDGEDNGQSMCSLDSGRIWYDCVSGERKRDRIKQPPKLPKSSVTYLGRDGTCYIPHLRRLLRSQPVTATREHRRRVF